MKNIQNIFKYGVMASAILAMTSCSEESNFVPTKAGLPQASDYQIGITVDDLNNVELNILDKNGQVAKGVFPVWYVNESTRPSTTLTYRDLITIMGDYPVEMKVGNANGISEGSVTGTIHIPKTIFDFTPYMAALTNGSSKDWAVDGTKDGNMGCGPDASSPTGWWNGGPGCKEAEGVYENVMTFTYTESDTQGTYTFDPGTSGTVYVNTGVHSLPGLDVNNPDDGNDFRVPAQKMEKSFTLSPEGASLYIVLPAHTLFPYIPSEAGFDNPKYRIAKFSKNEITLVQDLAGISWQYIIAPKAEADVTTSGFKYNGEHNLWKDAEVSVASTWFADGSWSPLPDQPEIADGDNIFKAMEVVKHSTWFAAAGWDDAAVDEPEVTFSADGYNFVAPAGVGGDQWMAQVHMWTNVETSAENKYDFLMTIEADKDIPGVTVKIQKGDSLGEDGDTDDNSYIVLDRIDVEGGAPALYFFKGKQGIDTKNLQVCMDYAGIQEGTKVTVSGIKMQVSK